MVFNEILIAERKKKGLNQEQLAELLNVSRQSISKWENGEAYPEYAKLFALAEVLDCSLDYLCGRDVPTEAAAANAAPVRNKKYLWLAVVLVIVALIVGVMIGRGTVDETPQINLPADFSAELVGLSSNADRVLKCEFVPSVVDESFEYRLVFRNDFDGEEEVFSVVPQAGTMIYIAELKYHDYGSLTLVVTNGDAQGVAVLAKQIRLADHQVSWTPAE